MPSRILPVDAPSPHPPWELENTIFLEHSVYDISVYDIAVYDIAV